MKALLSLQPGDASTLQLLDVADPVESPDQLLVRVRACGVNYPDALHIQDLYQVKQKRPFSPGGELCGVVERVGTNVQGFSPGDLVIGRCGTGAMAEKIAIAADRCVKIPADSPVLEAAGLVLTYATAYYALVDRARLQPGETLLVLGAAGGVGMSAIQIAKIAGARVIAAASTDDKCAFCKQLGADETINYSTQDLRERLKELTAGQGPDVIYDPVGGDFTELAFRSIAWRGRHLVVGFAAGDIPAIKINLALVKGASIVGVFWGDFARREPQANAAMMQQLAGWYAQGRIKPQIDRQMPMSELKAAYARMGSRQVQGKLVLVND